MKQGGGTVALELVRKRVKTWKRPAVLGMPAALLLMGALSLTAQQAVETVEPLSVEPVALRREPIGAALSPQRIHSAYPLGPNDGIRVWVVESDEVPSVPLRIGSSGYINIPMAGRFRAAGLTAEELEAEITHRLRRVIHEPTVSVTVTEFLSRPVSVIGAVNQPGVQQLRAPKTLLEVLSLAGGLRRDAGYRVRITRRVDEGPIDLPGVTQDETREFLVAEVDLDAVMKGQKPAHNILIRAHDVISVPRADMVYVMGEVQRAGGFVLEERDSVTVLQALSMAGGLGSNPALKRARILRPLDSPPEKEEIPLNLKAIMAGDMPDVALHQDDILFVPKHSGKAAAKAAARAAVTAATGIFIWRVGRAR